MTAPDLASLLPTSIAARIASATIKNRRAIVVIEATGLDDASRSGLENQIRTVLEGRADIDAVHVAFTAERRARRIVAVASGKGGVGKSTLTANLAVALARKGHKIGLVDADIYGPSQPVLLGNAGERPVAREDKLVPVPTKFGVPVLSMGHLVAPGKALAWRGPMAGGAVAQLVDAHWGEVETLLVDMPPGTGDVQLTMIQKFKPAGAVIVSTPQDLALIDAARAGQLFDQAGVPVIGLVENMAGYACPHCGEVSDPFGTGGVETAAARLEIPFLGRIPLALAIREGSDAGTPPSAGDSPEARPFLDIADKLDTWLLANV